jgi:hypothetical protein
MKPILRYRSQLLARKSYKPDRAVRIRPADRLGAQPGKAMKHSAKTARWAMWLP